jgi:hypothetical protein
LDNYEGKYHQENQADDPVDHREFAAGRRAGFAFERGHSPVEPEMAAEQDQNKQQLDVQPAATKDLRFSQHSPDAENDRDGGAGVSTDAQQLAGRDDQRLTRRSNLFRNPRHQAADDQQASHPEDDAEDVKDDYPA